VIHNAKQIVSSPQMNETVGQRWVDCVIGQYSKYLKLSATTTTMTNTIDNAQFKKMASDLTRILVKELQSKFPSIRLKKNYYD